MSYILEAIKRSERQRLVSGMTGLRTAPVFGEAAKPPPLLLYGAASAALIAAGIGIGWLRPWQHGHAPAAVAAVTPEHMAPEHMPPEHMPPARAPAEAAPPTLAAAPPIEAAEELHVMPVRPYKPHTRTHAAAPGAAQAAPAKAAAPAVVPVIATGSAAAPETRAPAAAPGAPPVSSSPPPAVTAAVAPTIAPVATMGGAAPPGADLNAAGVNSGGANAVGSATQAAPAEGRIRALYELPPQVLRDIPPMSISGFIYSDTPTGRMVDINDRLMQEGQYVADGLKLEQITPDGLIFSYRNYRFRKNLR